MRKTEYKGHESWIMENEKISIEAVPDLGGKLVSIYYKDKAFELLFQNEKPAMIGSSFGIGEACGFDDTFPSIKEELVSVNGKKILYPDHGEIWQNRMTVKMANEPGTESIKFVYDSSILPYHYEKKMMLTNSGVRFHYRITNTGSFAFPCIWTMHCLVRYEKDMKLFYPSDTMEFENVMEGGSLGKVGSRYPYRKAEAIWNSAEGEDSMCKYYISHPVTDGCCGYEYPSSKVRCEISYDAQKLPYLGVWITRGGFRGEYNLAMEPSNGYYDGVGTAQANGKCPNLCPGGQMEFELEIKIKGS